MKNCKECKPCLYSRGQDTHHDMLYIPCFNGFSKAFLSRYFVCFSCFFVETSAITLHGARPLVTMSLQNVRPDTHSGDRSWLHAYLMQYIHVNIVTRAPCYVACTVCLDLGAVHVI